MSEPVDILCLLALSGRLDSDCTFGDGHLLLVVLDDLPGHVFGNLVVVLVELVLNIWVVNVLIVLYLRNDVTEEDSAAVFVLVGAKVLEFVNHMHQVLQVQACLL